MSSDRVRAYFERAATSYDASIRPFERLMLKDSRPWAASRASGNVLKIGIGTGRNLRHYPPGIRLVGVDLSPAMLAFARQRAGELRMEVDLRVADAESLPFEAAAFDAIVCTFVLCSVRDERRTLAEIARVLKTGGELVLVEHVRSPVLAVRLVERVLDPLLARFAADHLLRDPIDHLETTGFEAETCERLAWGVIERTVAHKVAAR